MSYLVYARKYRPASFDQVIGQKPVVRTLKNAIDQNRLAHGYIFAGMRGVGKTTVARLLAKSLNCEQGPTSDSCEQCDSCVDIQEGRSVDVLEIDGASNTSVEDVRELREGIQYKPLHSRYKVIIIDEFHMLSKSAFNALLKTLEEPPPNTFFILATTELNKVPATIVSRCQTFEFKKITFKQITSHLKDIIDKENIKMSDYGIRLIAEKAEGSLRDAQSLLDQAVAFSGQTVKDQDLKEILGTISQDLLFQFSKVLLNGETEAVFDLVQDINTKGYDLRFFHSELITHFRNLLLVKTLKDTGDLLTLDRTEIQQIKEQIRQVSSDDILRCLNALQSGEQGLRYSSHPKIFFEVLMVKICQFKKIVAIQDILEHIKSLKSSTGKNRQKTSKKTTEVKPSPLENKTRSPQSNPYSVNEKKNQRKTGKNKERDKALKEPKVEEFLNTFKAQIISVDKKDKKKSS
ncbi:MAG: DNA polymerase III subunit gamma/tau [Candidatus Aminicenantes bacterium]|nr:DNA polymerase III subunit gamma/tau [Candidatus Aminicenantes bacterium]